MKPIPNFPGYSITKDGRVWSEPRRDTLNRNLRGKWLKFGKRKKYISVTLFANNRRYYRSVHSLVLETYVGPRPEGMQCRHLDGNSANNKLNNLCWGSSSENHYDAVKHGTHTGLFPEKRNVCKLTREDVRMIIYMYRTGLFLPRKIAKVYNVCRKTVGNIINKKTWKHLWYA